MSHTIGIVAGDTALFASALPLLGRRNNIVVEEREAKLS